MRYIVLLCVCSLVAAYTDMDDSLNIEAVAGNKTQLQKYLDCLLERSPCTAQMVPYKSHLLEALTDGCRECNDRERHLLKIFITTIRGLKNGDYELLKSRFDPNNHMETTFADFARF